MIRQVEEAARIILKAQGANIKKSTSGDWVLRMRQPDELFLRTLLLNPKKIFVPFVENTPSGALSDDFVGMEAEAFELVKRYHQANNPFFSLKF